MTRSYIVEAQTLAEVFIINIDSMSNKISLYTEDFNGVLAGTTVEYLHLVDLTDGQTAVEISSFTVEYVGVNFLPYFDPPISAFLQVFKQEEETPWEYVIPDYFDDNPYDPLSLSVDLSEVFSFLTYNSETKTFLIEDLADPELPKGSFRIEVVLSDGVEDLSFPIRLIIYDVGETPLVEDPTL